MKEDLKRGFQPSFRLEYKSLSPEERKKALEVAREVVNEAKILLGDQDFVDRLDPKNGRILTILGNKPEEVITPLDPKLTITASQYKGIGPDTSFEFHLYDFYLDHVNHFISYFRRQDWRIIEKRETVIDANAEDLTALLQNIRGSQPRKE